MKIILVHENVDDLSSTIRSKLLENGYELVPFTQTDEILQLGNHLGKVVTCFTDSRKAGQFISSCERFDSFHMINILCVARTPKITEDVENKLNKLQLKLYYPEIEDKLLKDLHSFFSGELKEDDLEFLTN